MFGFVFLPMQRATEFHGLFSPIFEVNWMSHNEISIVFSVTMTAKGRICQGKRQQDLLKGTKKMFTLAFGVNSVKITKFIKLPTCFYEKFV